MSRSVVPLVVALENEYGSLYKVPETDKTLQKIRKQLNKTVIEKPELLMDDKKKTRSYNSSQPCVLINKATGERYKFRALKYVGPAIGYCKDWGSMVKRKGSPTYRIELLPQNVKPPKQKSRSETRTNQ